MFAYFTKDWEWSDRPVILYKVFCKLDRNKVDHFPY